MFLSLIHISDTFNVQYFEVPAGSPDFYNGGTHNLGISNNYVLTTLGPDGLPIYNPSYGTVSYTHLDVYKRQVHALAILHQSQITPGDIGVYGDQSSETQPNSVSMSALP